MGVKWRGHGKRPLVSMIWTRIYGASKFQSRLQFDIKPQELTHSFAQARLQIILSYSKLKYFFLYFFNLLIYYYLFIFDWCFDAVLDNISRHHYDKRKPGPPHSCETGGRETSMGWTWPHGDRIEKFLSHYERQLFFAKLYAKYNRSCFLFSFWHLKESFTNFIWSVFFYPERFR